MHTLHAKIAKREMTSSWTIFAVIILWAGFSVKICGCQRISFPTETVSKEFGFRTQSFDAITDDGYISRLTRVQRTSGVDTQKEKFPILILHGLVGSSLLWTGLGNQPPISAYAFTLAQEGYDVWLGNFRGSPEASRHKFLNPSEKSFWDFTPDEHGRLDLPALINLVLRASGKDKLVYSGFSMGTHTFFIYCHYHPDACVRNVQAAIMLGPVLDMTFLADSNFLAGAGLLLPSGPYRKELTRRGVFKFPTPEVVSSLLPNAVNEKFVVYSEHPPTPATLAVHDIRPTVRTEVIDRVWPGNAFPTSLLTFDFYAQLTRTKKFQPLDYGPWNNLMRYGWFWPTSYDIGRTNVPVYLLAGTEDKVATLLDSAKIWFSLPKAKNLHVVPGFRHSDFIFSDNATIFVPEHYPSEGFPQESQISCELKVKCNPTGFLTLSKHCHFPGANSKFVAVKGSLFQLPDEHGKHDLPALINAVLYHSGKAKLVYSGYSLGTQSFFIYCHYHPEACRKKVQAAIMMAPVMDMSFLTDEKFLAIA
ncbi:unnamed protein product, partial [Notodromas monacha]